MVMKKNSCFFIKALMIIIISLPFTAYAKSDLNGLGAGIIVGEPTGISLKYKNFPIIGIAWSLENHFHFHMDYWVFNGNLKGPVDWFAGVGGKYVYFSNDKNKDKVDKHGIGIRVPLGVQYFIINNLELFGEIVPGISLIPSTSFDIDGGIGLRYYF